MSTKAEAINRINNASEHVAVTVWEAEDVAMMAQQIGVELTSVQIDDLLDTMDRKQDAELGITWTTLQTYIEEAGMKVDI
jgi:hypothetical protein